MRIFFNECTIAAILWTDENLPSVYLAADLAPVRFGELLFAPSFDGVPVYVHGDEIAAKYGHFAHILAGACVFIDPAAATV